MIELGGRRGKEGGAEREGGGRERGRETRGGGKSRGTRRAGWKGSKVYK